MNLRYFLYISPLLLGLVTPQVVGMMQILKQVNPEAQENKNEVQDEQSLSSFYTPKKKLSLKAQKLTSKRKKSARKPGSKLTTAAKTQRNKVLRQIGLSLEQQQQKETKSKRTAEAVVPESETFQAIEKEITDLDTEIKKSVDDFIKNKEFDMSNGLLTYKGKFFQEARERSENFSAKMKKEPNVDLREKLHGKLVCQRLKLDELNNIEQQKQKLISKMGHISKKTPTQECIIELQGLEKSIPQYECPNKKRLGASCEGRVHSICSLEVEHYRDSIKNMLTLRINDLKLEIESGIKKEIEREKELAKKLAEDMEAKRAKAQIKNHNTRPSMWTVLGATLAVSATVALFVKSYFWWLSKSSGVRA